MAKYPVVQDPTGRVIRQVTSQDELDTLKAQGYVPLKKETTSGTREPINTGSAGQLAARESSTTEGSEKKSGSTVRS